MGTFLKIDGDPNEVSGTAAVLRSMAESFRTQTQTVLGEINAVHAERPWGADSYGKAFETTYFQVPEGGEQSLPAMVEESMPKAGERLTKVAEKTILAMTEYQGTDTDNATHLNQANL
jgi:hypothetical protein